MPAGSKKPRISKPRAIVTGGAGFIGSHLVNQLVEDNWEVHVIDNLVNGRLQAVNQKAIFHKLDIIQAKRLEDLFKKIGHNSTVFHLACLPRVQFSIDFPEKAHRVNVDGTFNILHAAQRTGVKRVIYSASSSAYGNQAKLPLSEEMLPNPQSPYGLQKYLGELYCKNFSQIYGLETVCLRYFNVYGSNQDPNGSYAQAIPKLLEQRRLGKPLTITGNGRQTRDFTHVSDIVRANLLAVKSSKVGHGETINIGGGRNLSMNQVAKLIGGPITYIKARLEPQNTLAKISLAKKLLNWQPRVKLEEGLAELKRRQN